MTSQISSGYDLVFFALALLTFAEFAFCPTFQLLELLLLHLNQIKPNMRRTNQIKPSLAFEPNQTEWI